MTVALIFLAIIMASIIWWLARHTFNVRPWEATQETASPEGSAAAALERSTVPGSLGMPAIKVGLGLFLCVATSLFGLMMSAFYMRKSLSDWVHLNLPDLMWFNTAILVFSCLVVHGTRAAIHRGQRSKVNWGLFFGGLLTLVFLCGQLIAWRQLNLVGDTPTANSANAFFYLFTAVHALHLLGGLFVWARASVGAWFNLEKSRLKLRIELCTVYWDYLLIVWLVLFAAMLAS